VRGRLIDVPAAVSNDKSAYRHGYALFPQNGVLSNFDALEHFSGAEEGVGIVGILLRRVPGLTISFRNFRRGGKD
jgi:hypothetical protein